MLKRTSLQVIEVNLELKPSLKVDLILFLFILEEET